MRDAAWKTATGIGPLIMEVTRPNNDRSDLKRSFLHQHWANQKANPTRTDPTSATHNPDSGGLWVAARNSEPQAMLGKRRTPRRWMTPCATGGVQHGTKTRIVQTIGCFGSPCARRELPKTVWERAPLQDTCTQRPQGGQCLPMVTLHAGRFLRGPKIMATDLDGPTPNMNRCRNPHVDTVSKPV